MEDKKTPARSLFAIQRKLDPIYVVKQLTVLNYSVTID